MNLDVAAVAAIAADARIRIAYDYGLATCPMAALEVGGGYSYIHLPTYLTRYWHKVLLTPPMFCHQHPTANSEATAVMNR